MLSGNCTEALPVQAKVTISGSSAKLIKNGIAPLPFPPRAAKQYWYIKREERVRVRGQAQIYATLGLTNPVGEGAFLLESPLSFFQLHWDHEPTPYPSQEGN